MAAKAIDRLGVVVVTYGAADEIAACLDSLHASTFPRLQVVVVDNASPDDTPARVHDWAAAHGDWDFAEVAPDDAPGPAARLILIRGEDNLGFAGGVNLGLRWLAADPGVDLFWVLNPDSVVEPATAAAYVAAAEAAETFGLMGGRTLYHGEGSIQSDGGRVSLWTGICRNVNQGLAPEAVEMPPAASLDFISGANVVASRAFLEQVGPMREDYFLYYEEVDWALRRGELPLLLCPEAIVHHHGGTAIGSGSTSRRPSAFANYFNYRNRISFVARFNRLGLPSAYLYSALKIAKLLLLGAWDEAAGAFRGLNLLPPPRAVAARVAPEARARAFRRPGP
ncbi:MAG: glycosyltransferase family 2 protein [Pseudomonadota bacterium]